MSNKIGLPKDFELAEGTELDHNTNHLILLRRLAQSAMFASLLFMNTVSPWIVEYNQHKENGLGELVLSAALLSAAGNLLGRHDNIKANLIGLVPLYFGTKFGLENLPPLQDYGPRNFFYNMTIGLATLDGYVVDGKIATAFILGSAKIIGLKARDRIQSRVEEYKQKQK